MNSKLTKEKCLLIFIIGCIAGTIYEDLLEGFTNLNNTGIFSFNVHRGVIYGPLNIVYGAGAVLMVLLLKNDKLWYKIYLKGMLIGGIVTAGVAMMYSEAMGDNKRKMIKKGKKLARRMGIL